MATGGCWLCMNSANNTNNYIRWLYKTARSSEKRMSRWPNYARKAQFLSDSLPTTKVTCGATRPTCGNTWSKSINLDRYEESRVPYTLSLSLLFVRRSTWMWACQGNILNPLINRHCFVGGLAGEANWPWTQYCTLYVLNAVSKRYQLLYKPQ